MCQPRTETTVRPGWPRADFGAGLVGRHDRQRQHHSGRLHLEIYNPQGSVGGENQSNNTAITNDSAGNGNNRETGHRIDRPAGETSSPPARPATVTPHPKRHLFLQHLQRPCVHWLYRPDVRRARRTWLLRHRRSHRIGLPLRGPQRPYCLRSWRSCRRPPQPPTASTNRVTRRPLSRPYVRCPRRGSRPMPFRPGHERPQDLRVN